MPAPKLKKVSTVEQAISLVEEYAGNRDFINFDQMTEFLKTKNLVIEQKLFESALDGSTLCAFDEVTGKLTKGWVIHEAKSVALNTSANEGVMSPDLKHYMDNSQPGPDDTESHGEPLGQQTDTTIEDTTGQEEVGHSKPGKNGLTQEKSVDLKDSVKNDEKDTNWNLTNSLGAVVTEGKAAGGLQELRSNYKIISEGIQKSIKQEAAKLPNAIDTSKLRFVVESTNQRIRVKEPYRAIMIAEELSAIGGVKGVSISAIVESNGDSLRANYKLPNLVARLPLLVNGNYLFANKTLAEEFAEKASNKNQTSSILEHSYGAAVKNKMTLSEASSIIPSLAK